MNTDQEDTAVTFRGTGCVTVSDKNKFTAEYEAAFYR